MRHSPHLSDLDLQRYVDGESADRADRWGAHVEACELCARRRDARLTIVGNATRAVRSDNEWTRAEHDRLRTALALRMRAATRPADGNADRRGGYVRAAIARWSTVAAAIVAVLLTARALRTGPRTEFPRGAAVDRDALPISSLTPGATEDVTAEQLCGAGPRAATTTDPGIRADVLRDYGMAQVPEHEYELDYLITPQLGGTNDRRNLWPERYTDRTWNAKVKDQLEDLLPSLVCEGKVDLRTAQRDLAGNWVEAYKKYFKTQTPLTGRN